MQVSSDLIQLQGYKMWITGGSLHFFKGGIRQKYLTMLTPSNFFKTSPSMNQMNHELPYNIKTTGHY